MRKKRSLFMFLATFAMVGRGVVLGQPPTDFASLAPTGIRHAELNPDVPIFVPVHPRIATTISFPRAIGEPLGTGFIDAENLPKTADANSKTAANARGEYVIDYEQGDAFFTVQPTARSELLNLNIPFEGATIVFYFYPVQSPLSALASLILQDKPIAAATARAKPHSASAPPAVPDLATESPTDRIQKTDALPPSQLVPATPGRLDGFLRKLRMVHAAQRGPELDELAKALNVTISISTAEAASSTAIIHPVSDAGLYQLVLLRSVRDSALDAVGFVVLMRNTSDQPLVFDPRTFSARCGAALYTARVIDAPATLKPHETEAAYFAIVGAGDGRPGYLEADNDWKISVALVSP